MHELTRRLQQTRYRWRWRAVLHSLLAWITILVGMFVLISSLLLLAPVRFAPIILAAPRVFFVAIPLIILVAVMVRMLRQVPSLPDLAVLADLRFNLGGQLSTALDVQERQEGSLLAAALLEDAAAHAALVVPGKLLPLKWPRWGWALPVLLVCATGIWAVNPMLPPRSADPSVTESTPDLEQTVKTLQRVAELLGQEPDAGLDPYLRAVSMAFHDLGERLERSEVSADEAEFEIAQLLHQLSDALDGQDSELAQALSSGTVSSSSMGTPQSNNSAPPANSDDPASSARQDAGASMADSALVETGLETQADTGPESIFRTLGAVLDELERRSAHEELAAATSTERSNDAATGSSFGYFNIDPELSAEIEARRTAFRKEADGAGTPVDTADDSTDKAGDAAGDGSKPLEAGAAGNDLPVKDQAGVQVPLPWSEREESRHLSVDFEPAASLSRVAQIPDDATVTFSRHDESSVSREALGWAHRQLVSRYFLPDDVSPHSEIQ